MKIVDKAQVFIHKYYGSIKFLLLTITTGLVLVLFFAQLNANTQRAQEAAESSEERARAVQKVIEADQANLKEIKDNQEKQTRLITCLLAAHGERITITPEDEEACELLVDEAVEDRERNQTTPQTQDTPPNTSQNSTNKNQGSQNPGSGETETDEPNAQMIPEVDDPPSEPPNNSRLQSLLNLLSKIFNPIVRAFR